MAKKHRDADDFAREQAAKRSPGSNQTDKLDLLRQIADRYWKAWERVEAGTAEWVEGSLQMAAALAEARGHFTADRDFGQWLKQSTSPPGWALRHNGHDRAALIYLGRNLELAREILEATDSRSYRLIWADLDPEEQARFDSGVKPRRKSPTAAELEEEELRRVERKADFMPVSDGTVTKQPAVELEDPAEEDPNPSRSIPPPLRSPRAPAAAPDEQARFDVENWSRVSMRRAEDVLNHAVCMQQDLERHDHGDIELEINQELVDVVRQARDAWDAVELYLATAVAMTSRRQSIAKLEEAERQYSSDSTKVH